MDYLISVIIPVFNADKKSFLSVLNCVRNQQREDFPIEKIIVFDGNPSFEIHRIIADFSDFCFITIEHSGVSVARNEGIKRATGKYLVFVDADDELPEHMMPFFHPQLNIIAIGKKIKYLVMIHLSSFNEMCCVPIEA